MRPITSRILIWLFLTMSWGIAQNHDLPYQDKIDALKSAIEFDSKLTSDSSPKPNVSSREYVLAQLDSIVVDLQNPNLYAIAKSRLEDLLGNNSSDDSGRALKDLIAAINTRESESIQASKTKEADLEKRLSTIILNAKSAKDVDLIIKEITEVQKITPVNNFFVDGTTRERLGQSLNLAVTWQNYLHCKETGDLTGAHNVLQTLTTTVYGTTVLGIVPRSFLFDQLANIDHPKVLFKQDSPSGASQAPEDLSNETALGIVHSVKTFDEIAGGIEKLSLLEESVKKQLNSETEFQCKSAIKLLTYTKNTCGDLQSGILPPNTYYPFLPLRNPPMHADDYLGIDLSTELHEYIQHLFIRTYFDRYTGQDWQPNENLLKYISRVTNDANTRMDWLLLKKISIFHHYLNNDTPANSYNSMNTVYDTLVQAKNQEDSGQFADAVASYRRALGSSDPDLPVQIIGTHLQAIQKDHPKEYNDGTSRPVMPTY